MEMLAWRRSAAEAGEADEAGGDEDVVEAEEEVRHASGFISVWTALEHLPPEGYLPGM